MHQVYPLKSPLNYIFLKSMNNYFEKCIFQKRKNLIIIIKLVSALVFKEFDPKFFEKLTIKV